MIFLVTVLTGVAKCDDPVFFEPCLLSIEIILITGLFVALL
ncbi:hypothetical protein KR100_04885 [Synechococcus sp. KORDI-100]|nr:hypothetical protein KR100_04885 [Synechococcus sp. KORDI-100]